MPERFKLLRAMLRLSPAERQRELKRLSDQERAELGWHWRLWARSEQLAPRGTWSMWMVMAGRGFGKTRCGAEWVRQVARRNPEARIALVGASLNEVRAVMVEGESGILAVCPPDRRPVFEPSLRRLTWPNGAQATCYSAAKPESLRGPQHNAARRAGAKGGDRQRNACPARLARLTRGRGDACQPAREPGGRRTLYRGGGRYR